MSSNSNSKSNNDSSRYCRHSRSRERCKNDKTGHPILLGNLTKCIANINRYRTNINLPGIPFWPLPLLLPVALGILRSLVPVSR